MLQLPIGKIKYDEAGPSVWGAGESLTLKTLSETDMHGEWLSLAVGDGRYVETILSQDCHLTATDIDPEALRVLKTKFSSTANALETKIVDLREPLPYADQEFDGCVCTGTLHFFNPDEVRQIVEEMHRVTRSGGVIFIDFPTEVRRTLEDGSVFRFPGEMPYQHEFARTLLVTLFKTDEVSLTEGVTPDEKTNLGECEYTYQSQFFVLKAVIRKNSAP